MEKIKTLISLLEYKLKIIHKYDSMDFNLKIDYDEEISSILPYDVDEEISNRYFEFDKNIKKNSKRSSFAKYLEKLFGECWTLFVFLNIVNSFKKLKAVNSSNDDVIQDSYVNSQIIFKKNVESFQNFIVIIGGDLNTTLIAKISILTHISIKIMIDLNVLKEKKNYSKTPKNNKADEFYYKSIYNYRLNINVKTVKNFNVENKFYRSPLQIIDYKYPIEKRIKTKENKFKTSFEWKHKSLISGPTYIRSEPYDKINPYSSETIQTKNKNLKTIFSETKFYPDIAFIEHLKKKFYQKLNIEEINQKMIEIKLKFEKYFEKTNWDEEITEEISSLQQQYAKLLEDQKTFIFLNHRWEKYYHLSSSNDYRGRKYYCSPLTFTHFKLSRFCFHYGDDGEISKSYFDWSNYESIFEELHLKTNKDLTKIKEIVGFYLIGLGKLDESRKLKIETSLEEILLKGKNIFLSEKNFLYEEMKEDWLNISLKKKIDAIECECYKFGLKSLLNGDMTKRIIIKDATASGYQIQAYLIGSKDEKKLKYLNIGSENIFVDTYLFIVKEFSDSSINNKIPDWALKYFKRNIIKKFCMIIPYSAGFKECFSSITEFIDPEDLKKSTLIFSMFYDFIKKDVWHHFGLNSSFKEFIKKHIDEKDYYVESETALANLKYNKKHDKEYDTKYINLKGEKIRTSREYFIITEDIDLKKTMTAFAPNFTHFHDSEIIRILHLEPYNLKFASIHDAFIISSFECGKLTHSYGNIFKIKMRFNHKIPITCLM